MVKIKDKNHRLAIAIQENFSHGMKPKDIAELFHLSKQRVNYWIHRQIRNEKRRAKLNSLIHTVMSVTSHVPPDNFKKLQFTWSCPPINMINFKAIFP